MTMVIPMRGIKILLVLLAMVAVGCGGSETAMPDVQGLPLDIASRELRELGLSVESTDAFEGKGIWDDSNWTVTAQDPAPGQIVERRDKVHLEVKHKDYEARLERKESSKELEEDALAAVRSQISYEAEVIENVSVSGDLLTVKTLLVKKSAEASPDEVSEIEGRAATICFAAREVWAGQVRVEANTGVELARTTTTTLGDVVCMGSTYADS